MRVYSIVVVVLAVGFSLVAPNDATADDRKFYNASACVSTDNFLQRYAHRIQNPTANGSLATVHCPVIRDNTSTSAEQPDYIYVRGQDFTETGGIVCYAEVCTMSGTGCYTISHYSGDSYMGYWSKKFSGWSGNYGTQSVYSLECQMDAGTILYEYTVMEY